MEEIDGRTNERTPASLNGKS